jgi:adenylate cyclase
VVNTTSRLEALARSLHLPVLISDELLRQLVPLPPRVEARTLGDHAIRGRDQVMAVSTLAVVNTLSDAGIGLPECG